MTTLKFNVDFWRENSNTYNLNLGFWTIFSINIESETFFVFCTHCECFSVVVDMKKKSVVDFWRENSILKKSAILSILCVNIENETFSVFCTHCECFWLLLTKVDFTCENSRFCPFLAWKLNIRLFGDLRPLWISM